MKASFFFFFSVILLVLFPNLSHSATILVDGVTHWKHPTVNIGDSIIFRNRDQSILYIFRNKSAFSLCNFTEATPLIKPNSSSYTWNPSRLGSFYFGFSNGTEIACKQGKKLAIKVIQTPAPEISVEPPLTPPPTPGGVVSSSPAFPWPFQPREKSGSPAPSGGETTAMSPLVPGGSIDSNPSVPLPTGEEDSATIRPLPTSTHDTSASRQLQVVGLLGFVVPQCIAILSIL